MATLIVNVTQLQAINDDLTADYELGTNIDASATSTWNEDPGNPGTYFGFDPIGMNSPYFTGSFDGKGYTINDLFINRPTNASVGLFGVTGDGCGTIQNVGLLDCDITGRSFTGALIGYQSATGGAVSTCYSTGSVSGERAGSSSLGAVGGLIGYATGSITSCYSTCTVTATHTGTSYIDGCGGLIGSHNAVLTITSCYAAGAVSITAQTDILLIGGLIGNTDAVVSKCYSTGSVTIDAGEDADQIGGLVGENTANISDCYARGAVAITAGVTANSGDIGGFVGLVNDVSAILDNCYSTGAITATDIPDVGGFCGDNSGTVTNCFWDTQTSGEASSDGGTGKTTAQMKTEATFTDAGWDFSTIWSIEAVTNDGYPALTGIGTAPTVTTQAVSSIAAETATGNGNITALGSPNPIAHGVCYNTTGSPTVADDTTDEGAATTTGAFTSSMTSLSINTKYYVKAYAANVVDTSYGSEVNFTTLGVPTIITQTCESVVGATATGRGDITVIGNPTPTAHGHCWNTTVDPVITDDVVDNGAASAIGTFTSAITGLTPGTAYYTRAYATNTQGTVYGANVYFVASTDRAGYTWDESSNLRSFDENAIERQYIHTNDVDDTPANGATTDPISSNWAFDHVAAADPHTGYVLESLFDAQTILQATSDDTPTALTVTEQTVVGRLTGGNISAVAIGISDNNVAQIDGTSNAPANLDYAKFTTSGLEGRSYQELVNDISGVIKATDVEVSELSTATYDDAQDYMNFFGDRTLLSGGAITARADALTGVNTGGAGLASFEISGDLTATYKEDDIITVNGSTANDGNYTLKADSTHAGGTTTITVDEAVSDGTVNGSIYGAANVASGTAWAKATDSDTAVGKFFNFSADNTVTLTNLITNYIYLDYNAGTPQIAISTSITTLGFKQDHIHIATIFRNGPTLHFHEEDAIGIGRINIADMHLLELRDAERVSGLVTSDNGSLSLSITSGVLYEGLNRHTTVVDGSTWSYWYTSDSGTTWTEDTDISALVQSYNDITSGKVSLGTGKYGVHWVYCDIDGENLFIIYGRGNYNANEAEEAAVPSVLPDIAVHYGVLIAKIINREGTNTLTISYPWTSVFTSSLATDHNSLANLTTGDVHTQYFLLAGEATAAQLHSGADLIVYSDAGSTEVARIDGATGAITTSSTVDGIDVSAHDTATTGVHGAGANTIASTGTKLDDFATPDDNTDLNSTTTEHGLLKKLDNTATNFMNGQGNWSAPAGGASSAEALAYALSS